MASALSAGAVTERVFFRRFTATSLVSGSASTARSTRAEHAEQLIPVTSKRRCANAGRAPSAVAADSVGWVMARSANETQLRFENLYARSDRSAIRRSRVGFGRRCCRKGGQKASVSPSSGISTRSRRPRAARRSRISGRVISACETVSMWLTMTAASGAVRHTADTSASSMMSRP